MKLFKVIILIILSIGLLPSTSHAATKTMKVHFINVGQEDATYIKIPDGEDVLIDGGSAISWMACEKSASMNGIFSAPSLGQKQTRLFKLS